jgi:hypothetical protein
MRGGGDAHFDHKHSEQAGLFMYEGLKKQG